MSTEDFIEINQLRGDDDTILLQKPSIEQIIPLVKVHTSAEYRPRKPLSSFVTLNLNAVKAPSVTTTGNMQGSEEILTTRNQGWT